VHSEQLGLAGHRSVEHDLLAIGDQVAVRSGTELSVSSTRPVPSAFITQISKVVVPPSILQLNRIRVPSGDQAGARSS
jgi:hypothetical protein